MDQAVHETAISDRTNVPIQRPRNSALAETVGCEGIIRRELINITHIIFFAVHETC